MLVEAGISILVCFLVTVLYVILANKYPLYLAKLSYTYLGIVYLIGIAFFVKVMGRGL